MDPRRYQLLHLLADGHFHSGEALGATLEMSRGGVWKHIKSLEELGVRVYAVPGKGYRLPEPLALLDRETVLAQVDAELRGAITGLDIHTSIPSTNSSLMERAALGLPGGFICMAEHQTAGRGRRGRHWVSPFAANLYLSLLWRFASPPDSLAALSLAMAVAAARGIRELGITEAGLKWPNDILCAGRKLAGILLEMAGESSGPCHIVVGIGVNVNMPDTAGETIDQPWTDMQEILGRPTDRNLLAAKLIQRMILAFGQFEKEGLAPFRQDWRDWDATLDRWVRVQDGRSPVTGVARGLDENGALLVEVDGTIRRFHSGEVSIRL